MHACCSKRTCGEAVDDLRRDDLRRDDDKSDE
jgi:hypothetical protein